MKDCFLVIVILCYRYIIRRQDRSEKKPGRSSQFEYHTNIRRQVTGFLHGLNTLSAKGYNNAFFETSTHGAGFWWLITSSPSSLEWQPFTRSSRGLAVQGLTFVTLLHVKWVVMCQAYFCSSKEFAAGVWKCWFWDFSCNCLRNHLSLVCHMERAHVSVFHGRKHDFLTPPYCFNLEVFNF